MDNNSTFNSSSNSTNGTSDGFQFNAAPKPFWTNLLLPIIYLTILIGSLYTFSHVYRQRKITKAARLENWFPPHRQRDIYLSLLHIDPQEASEGGEKKLSKVPDSVLKAALLRRAVEDIQRIVVLRSSKPALQTLLQRGSVGDELWQRFLRAEKEMEEEVKDVVNEANAFAPNWGQTIFQSANEINQNRLIKERIAELQSQIESEKAWWDKKRAGISSDFMKELEDESNASKAVEAAIAAAKKSGSSDDDAVLVEGGGPGIAQGAAKKNKAKK
ncbi:hypothetical protein M409DRAFT_25186 [Zasmidium cellare ATCC 36951]|uniref:Translocation protein sec66 n=1 Tax=Zasmidium cellare ATCC 36951 TaxID=1080233 RepID=A0A6A6CAU1_ZASCE|nr:uncharacterized protein M409DRAFT_25186 [Zasmidium cellare ATCC 36951]KAF2164307.1 hypothetical protein M409DRAFT_25186 [Zasmidium cellare ATCC 36951]